MMNFIRRNTKYFLWVIATVFIIGVFFWNFTPKPIDYVAKVNGVKILYNNFRRDYEKELLSIRKERKNEELPESTKNRIKEEVLKRLIFDLIFIQETKKHKINVSKAEIASIIRSDPGFQYEGKFSRKRYYAVLKYLGITPPIYEKQLEQTIKKQKLHRIIFSGIQITDLEIKQAYKTRKQGDLSQFENDKESFKESFKQEKKMLLFNHWLETLQKKYKIVNKLEQIEKQIEEAQKQEQE